MSEAKIRQGTKISEEEMKTLDRAKMGVSLAGKPEAADVEGQYEYLAYTQCPWCGHIGRSVVDTNFYQWYTCGMCGGAFRA